VIVNHGCSFCFTPISRDVMGIMLSSFAGGSIFGEKFGEAPYEVLALHGWGRSHKDFDATLRPADGPEISAIAVDLPGFGATPPPTKPFGSSDYAASLLGVLDDMAERVIVVGHSHGGRVAVMLAALRPEAVAGIVLVGAPVLRRASSTKPSLGYRLLRVAHRARFVSDARMEQIRQKRGSADYAAAHGVMRDTLVTVVNESFAEELPMLRCPVTLVWGVLDQDVPVEIAEAARDLIGSGHPAEERGAVRLVLLDGVGHLVPTQAPTAIRAAIMELA